MFDMCNEIRFVLPLYDRHLEIINWIVGIHEINITIMNF